MCAVVGKETENNRRITGKIIENDDEDLMVEVVVVDVDGKPGCTGNGNDPSCALLVFPIFVGEVATVGKDAAAAAAAAHAAGQEDAWLEEVDAVAVVVAAAGVAATPTACLDETVGGQCDVDPDVKAMAGEAIGSGVCEADVEKVC